MTEDSPRLTAAREALAEEYPAPIKRHIFICAEAQKAKCCPPAIGAAR